MLIKRGRQYKLRSKIDDLMVTFNGISVSAQPFVMKMYNKRKFNKNMGFFSASYLLIWDSSLRSIFFHWRGSRTLEKCRKHVATPYALPLVTASY